MILPFDPGDRTYYLSDERMRAFQALTLEQRLQWVEEIGQFLRLARLARQEQTAADPTTPPEQPVGALVRSQ